MWFWIRPILLKYVHNFSTYELFHLITTIFTPLTQFLPAYTSRCQESIQWKINYSLKPRHYEGHHKLKEQQNLQLPHYILLCTDWFWSFLMKLHLSLSCHPFLLSSATVLSSVQLMPLNLNYSSVLLATKWDEWNQYSFPYRWNEFSNV